MSNHRKHRRKDRTRKRLYKSKKHSMISGVCYGVATHFGLNVLAVRVLTVILLLANPLVTAAIYFLMAWMLPDDPGYEAQGAEVDITVKVEAAAAADATDYTAPLRTRHKEVVRRFEALNRRLADMERTVTSREFQMDRELRRSQNGEA